MFLAFLLTACTDTRAVRGEVRDVWGHPVQDATVVLEGVVERFHSDRDGHFAIDAKEPVVRVLAGKEGFIPGMQDTTAPSEEADYDPLVFQLYPKPAKAGFYGVGREGYVALQGAPVRIVGSDVRHYAGVRDIPEEKLPRGEVRLVFQTTLRPSEISQMNLHLTRLRFVAHTPMKGILGTGDVTVNLWVAEDEVPFDLESLPGRNDYLIRSRGTLESGVYAFHAHDVLNEVDERVIMNLPKERQVAFPFEVE